MFELQKEINHELRYLNFFGPFGFHGQAQGCVHIYISH